MQIKRKLLRDKIVEDCKVVLKKRDVTEETEGDENQIHRAKTLHLNYQHSFFQKSNLDSLEVGEDDNLASSPTYCHHDEKKKDLYSDPSLPETPMNLQYFKKFGSKTAGNMKELKNGIGLSKLVGYDEKQVTFKKQRLPSIGAKANSKPSGVIITHHKRESKTPSNLKLMDDDYTNKNPSVSNGRRLGPIFKAIKEEGNKEDRPLVSTSIIQKNINLISQLPKNYSHITDVSQWLKKNRLDPGTKVFIVSPAYPDIKNALLDRGWIENADYDSVCYHLKYSLKGKDIAYDHLQNYQLVNHFEKASNITTKSGLCKSMKNMIWCCHETSDSFFPKCFDTADDSEYETFTSYYKILKAEGILKDYLAKTEHDRIAYLRERRDQILAAITVSKKRLMEIDDIIEAKGIWTEVTQFEWEKLSVDEKKNEREREPSLDLAIVNKGKKQERGPKGFKKGTEINSSLLYTSKSMEINHGDLKQIEIMQNPLEIDINNEAEVTKYIKDLIKNIEEKFPQTSINGSKNIWIVKPAGLSRGRGIRIFNNLGDIHNYSRGKDNNWVIQKYIEHPILYHGRKLDIRQWVMVTDWNPLTIWFYGECYIRLSTSEYDLSDLSNKFSHLTNNSINKHAKNFEKESSFLGQDEFAEYLKTLPNLTFKDPFAEKIQPKMKEIVKYTLMCVQDMVENRKNSSEIYGYDFCIDDQLNPWLIEINASPAWDYSSVSCSNIRA